MLEGLINQLDQELNMGEAITRPDTYLYSLSFADQITIHISQMDQTLLLKGQIISISTEKNENLLIKLLEANLFGKGTRGAAIGLSEDGNLLTLSLELDYNISYKDFKNKLEDFVSVIDFWRQEALK